MNEMKLATWRLPAAQLVPPASGDATMLNVDLSSHPDLVGHLADWTAVSHTIVAAGDDLVVTILLRRVVSAPDSPEGVGA